MKKLMLFVVLSGVIAAGCFSSTSDAQNKELPKTSPLTMKLSDPLPANLFVELAKVVNPAVVNISTSSMPRNRSRQRDPLFDMLERFYGQQGGVMPQQSRPAQSLGTGFIIRDDGLIITNNHVIAQADIINVQLDEKDKMYEATVIGRDERTDIALIKIKADKKLPYVVLGSSSELQVGEWVAAFGNPYGYGHTMTKGIISAKVREISELNRFPLLQTDTSINPGNSGGPLVNTKGQVIGVNSAIDARAQGIGFAIPIDEVKKIIPMLEKDGQLKRGYIGVMLGDLDPRYAKMFGMEPGEGVVITNTEKNGPAAKAGMKPYDVITEINGKKIKTTQEMLDSISNTDIGTIAKIKVLRDGKKIDLNVAVIARPNEVQAKKQERPQNQNGQEAPHNIGFEVSNSNPQLAEQQGVPDELKNKPMVVRVQPGSVAQMAGINPGDVIIDVNRKDVNSAADVMKNLKKGQNTIRLARGAGVVITMFETE